MNITGHLPTLPPKARKYVAGALIAGSTMLQGCAGYTHTIAKDIYASQKYLATQTDIKARDYVKLEEKFAKLKTWPMERDAWKHVIDSIRTDSAFNAGIKHANDSIKLSKTAK